ncbi:hypothetical protein [Longimicrobium sp.]|uniref:hypothetical protein n=1 Tax=Longimicrobium sp. TaxID=2029185 RepID=UPI002E311420|nr:hypothetical protein [Longimicrobium sp.]HEX6037309.1 hypothetical protein [Longimicrobium sp.]
MTLAFVLWVKIVATALLWAGPLLLFPARWLHRLGYPKTQPAVFTRLLGAAFTALLVGYVLGLRMLQDVPSTYPRNTVIVGAVSNGLACAILLIYGLKGAYAEWGRPARFAMWLSAGITGFVTVGLLTTR